MSAIVIDGRASAGRVLDAVARLVAKRLESGRPQPYLAAILADGEPSSESYVRSKRKAADRVGIASSEDRLAPSATTDDVLRVVERLQSNDKVSGILPQLPLPRAVDPERVIEAIGPVRDVDGFHPINAGRLALGVSGIEPCTPAGIIKLLDDSGVAIEGRRAVVVGRSNIVGKPTALMLLARHATVTVCHSRTADLPAVTREADILVAAAGEPGLITREMVKEGAAVIDVGMTRVDGKLTGDVAPEVAEVAGWVTPVPGGVGPMTVAMLMANTLRAEQTRRGT